MNHTKNHYPATTSIACSQNRDMSEIFGDVEDRLDMAISLLLGSEENRGTAPLGLAVILQDARRDVQTLADGFYTKAVQEHASQARVADILAALPN